MAATLMKYFRNSHTIFAIIVEIAWFLGYNPLYAFSAAKAMEHEIEIRNRDTIPYSYNWS